MAKYTNDGRPIEGGRLVTSKQDFSGHVNGTDWRHTANQIDMNPPINAGGGVYNDATVQGTLEKIVETFVSGGQSYITIGDGYASGDITIGDPGISTLQDALNAAFGLTRLQNGGVILIKASTYNLTSTVTVPYGISIIGEPTGTNIIAVTAEQPCFIIQSSAGRFAIGGGNTTVEPVYQNSFVNLNIFDNLNGSEPSMSAVPIIQCMRGSNLNLKSCKFIGKVGTNTSYRVVDYSGPTGAGSTLHVDDCFFDGFQTSIEFDCAEGSADYLTVKSTHSRTFGDKGAGSIDNRAFVAFTVCNAVFTDNFHEGISPVWGAEACYLIKNVVVGNISKVSITIHGTSGGLSNAYTSSGSRFLVDNRSSPISITTTDVANTWGGHDDEIKALQTELDLYQVQTDSDILELQTKPVTVLVTSNGAWNPFSSYPWAKRLLVRLCGGGGGGGAGYAIPAARGGAGGGSGYLSTFECSAQTLTFTFGPGGAGSSSSGSPGSQGGTSSCFGQASAFGLLSAYARGGSGGQSGNQAGNGGNGYSGGGGHGGGASGGTAGNNGGNGVATGGTGIITTLGAGSGYPGGDFGSGGGFTPGGGGGGGHFYPSVSGQTGQGGSSAGAGGKGYGGGGGGGTNAGNNGGAGAAGAALITIW